MTSLSVATSYVLPDEKVWAFEETWRRSAVFGDRRIQRIGVLRGDQVAVYEEDVGPFNPAKDQEFRSPCFWLYSVAEMREVAQLAREDKPLQEPENRMDIRRVFLETLEERKAQREHRSVVGPHFRKERR